MVSEFPPTSWLTWQKTSSLLSLGARNPQPTWYTHARNTHAIALTPWARTAYMHACRYTCTYTYVHACFSYACRMSHACCMHVMRMLHLICAPFSAFQTLTTPRRLSALIFSGVSNSSLPSSSSRTPYRPLSSSKLSTAPCLPLRVGRSHADRTGGATSSGAHRCAPCFS